MLPAAGAGVGDPERAGVNHVSRGRRDPRRVLPHSLDAETGVLGGLMMRHHLLAQLSELEPDDFYDPRHRAVFSAMRDLEATGKPLDVVLIEDRLAVAGKLEAMGGVAFLGELALRVPTPDNVIHYAEVVRAKRTVRDVMLRLSEFLEHGYAGTLEDEELIDKIASMAQESLRRQKRPRGKFLGAIVLDEFKRIGELRDKAAETGKPVQVGIPTGLANIDEIIGGITVGPPFGIAARPGGTKTTLGQQIAEYQAAWLDAQKEEGIVVFCSNEDADSTFGQRSMARSSGVPSQMIRRVQLSDRHWGDLAGRIGPSVRSKVLYLPIHGLSGPQVARLLHRVAAEHRRIRMVWIDYFQNLFWPERIRDENQAITANCQALGAMSSAADGGLDCGLGVLIQLKRKEEGSEPTLNDLRGSGWLEQFVKVCIGLHHPWSHAKGTANPLVRTDPRDDKLVTEDYMEGHLIKNFMGEANRILRFKTTLPCHRYEVWPEEQRALDYGAGDHPNAPGAR